MCGYTRAELTGPAAPQLLEGGLCKKCGWEPLDHGARAMVALACFCVFVVDVSLARRFCLTTSVFVCSLGSTRLHLVTVRSAGCAALTFALSLCGAPLFASLRMQAARLAFLGVRCALPVADSGVRSCEP